MLRFEELRIRTTRRRLSAGDRRANGDRHRRGERRASARCRFSAAVLVVASFICAVPVIAGDKSIAQLKQLEDAFQSVVGSVAPSVVGVRVQRRYLADFSDLADEGPHTFEQLVIVNGSGTIVDSAGLILTNEHVVQDAIDIQITFHDGDTVAADVVASDARSDLAILRVQRQGLKSARFCDWNEVARGQWTIALGNPFGLGGDGQLSVSVGVISNLHRRLPGLGEVDDRLYDDMIQTTAEINPGNSGGPLFNIDGEMVGIVTAMHTRAGGDEGVGFALPIDDVRRQMIRQLASGHAVEYGYLGLTIRSDTNGAAVDGVEPAGPAARAGVQRGDIIVRFAEEAVRDSNELTSLVGRAAVGRRVPIELRRDGATIRTEILVARREPARVSALRNGAILWRGLRLANRAAPLGPGAAGAEFGGVAVIDVLPGSPANRAGLAVGDVIVEVDGDPAPDVVAFRLLVRGARGGVKLGVADRGEILIQP